MSFVDSGRCENQATTLHATNTQFVEHSYDTCQLKEKAEKYARKKVMSNEKNPAVIQLEQLLAQYYEGSTGQVAAVSSSKLQAVVKHALKYCQQYKFIVWAVERYLHKCPAEYRIFGIYTIDKLARTMQ